MTMDSIKVDGRVLRAKRTAERIVTATRGMMTTGNWRPRVVDIALAARVSTRSVFQHFDDVAKLYKAAMTDEMRATMAARLRALDDEALVDFLHGTAARGGGRDRRVAVPGAQDVAAVPPSTPAELDAR